MARVRRRASATTSSFGEVDVVAYLEADAPDARIEYGVLVPGIEHTRFGHIPIGHRAGEMDFVVDGGDLA